MFKCKDCKYHEKWGTKYKCTQSDRNRDNRYKIYVGRNKKACKFFNKK